MKEYGTVGGAVIDNSEYEEYRSSLVTPEKDPSERQYVQPEAEPVPEHDPIAYAEETIETSLISSDYFIATAQERDINLADRSDTRYLHLLHDMVNEYLAENEDFFMAIDGGETYHALKLLGTAPYALKQQQALDKAEYHGNRSGAKHAKDVLIEFNGTVFKFIESNPSRSPTFIADLIERTTTSYDPEAKGYAYNKALEIVDGMKTEFAFFQSVNYKKDSGYSARRGTADQDKHGIDALVTVPDVEEMLVDLKSSLGAVKDKEHIHTPTYEEPYTKTKDGQYVYAPYIDDNMFEGDSFKLDTGSKIRLRNKILEQLQKMAKL